MSTATRITVETAVNQSAELVWKLWSDPEHIVHWNAASPDWHSPAAESDLRTGGRFKTRMEARDGSAGFDFEGEYSEVEPGRRLAYTLPDGRNVEVDFKEEDGGTTVTETFDAEGINSEEMQRAGWQAILDNFKTYAEAYTGA